MKTAFSSRVYFSGLEPRRIFSTFRYAYRSIWMRVSFFSIRNRIVFLPLRTCFAGSTRMSRWYESRSLLARYGPYSPRSTSARVGAVEVVEHGDNLVDLFAESHHDACLGGDGRAIAPRPIEELERSGVLAARPRHPVQPRHGLDVVIEDVGPGVEYRSQRGFEALE